MKKRYLLALGAVCVVVAAGNVLYFAVKPRHNVAPPDVSRQKPIVTALSCVEEQPDGFLVGQVLMIGVSGQNLAARAALFRQLSLGGVVLTSAPLDPSDGSIQVFKMAAVSLGVSPIIASDEEGGMIQRFSALGTLPSPQEVAAVMTPAQAQQMVTQYGQKLKAAGVDMVLGPLADVAPAQGESVLGNRVFSDDPHTVAAFDRAYVQGWQAAGLTPVLKHFPGMGSATGNTDYTLATTPPLTSLQQRDFIPYEGGMADTATAVMMGNQTVPGWFSGPASLSPAADSYLRDTLGYHANLIITDSLSAVAVTSVTDQATAAVDAIIAGNDMAIVADPPGDMHSDTALLQKIQAGLTAALHDGTLTRRRLAEAVARKLQTQRVDPCTIREDQ